MTDDTRIRKRNKQGKEADYWPRGHFDDAWREEWELRGANEVPDEKPNIRCVCGCDQFRVCWWDFPPVGGFCRIVCANCGNAEVLIDEWA